MQARGADDADPQRFSTDGIGPEGSAAVADRWAARVAQDPADRIARHNLAVELFRLDQPLRALEELDRAWREGLRTGETALMRGHALTRLGRLGEAEAAYLEAIARKPHLVDAPKALAALRPQQRTAAGGPLDGFRAALAAAPETGQLWIEAMAAAKGHRDWVQLLEWARAAESRFGRDTVIAVFAANALSGLGRDEDAHEVLRGALAAEPGFAPAHTTLAHVAIRLGDYRTAAAAAASAARLAPADQSGWALLATAWRLLGDPREDWLCRYDHLIMEIDLELPRGLSANLCARHRMQAHPADQSLRGGTQTPGNLFETADPAIVALAEFLREAIEHRIASLPAEPDHPFLARNSGRIRFAASWSARLADQGYHISHIHPAGWMSSALYVDLPPEVAAGGQGLLTFGVPDAALDLDLGPRRIVQPAIGRLVLFPSYVWHGTTPFGSTRPRLTVAFDMVPVDKSFAPA